MNLPPIFVGAGLLGALVASPPEGADEVGVLLCAIDDCSDRMFWVSHEPALQRLPIVVVDTLLAEDAATVAQGELAAAAFREALAGAHAAAAAKKWRELGFRLDDAEAALGRWRGSPTNQELFELAFLRGVAAIGRGEGRGATDLRQAAALAWNRAVRLPSEDPAVLAAWDAALAEVVAGGTGALRLAPGSADPLYSLDGVPLGAAPLRVNVFPGVHRVSALDERTGLVWTAQVAVTAGGEVRATARFPGGSDPAWVAQELMATVDTHRMGGEVADLLGAWAGRHGLRRLRLLRLDPLAAAVDPAPPPGEPLGAAPASTPLFTLRSVTWEPLTRRLSVP